MYYSWRIPAHHRCTHLKIILHLMDIRFLPCICLWQISQIQTWIFSTSPAFMRSSTSHSAGPHARLVKKTVNGRGVGSTQFEQQFVTTVTAPPLVGCVVWSHNITLTTTQVQEAIQQSKTNNSQGPDKLNIRHLKHIC